MRTSQECFSKRKLAILNLLEISEYNCEKRDTITWTSKKKNRHPEEAADEAKPGQGKSDNEVLAWDHSQG